MRKKSEIREYYDNYKWDKCKYMTYYVRVHIWIPKEEAIKQEKRKSRKEHIIYYNNYQWEKCSRQTYTWRVKHKYMNYEKAILPKLI